MIIGRNIANPTSLIMSAVLMLRHVGLESHAECIGNAVTKVLKSGRVTRDLGGSLDTTEFTEAVIDSLDQSFNKQ
jgi:isocitrate dehydrogenase (NAD+)